MHFREWMLGVVAVGSVVSTATPAYSFGFKEHNDVCYASYMASCEDLEPNAASSVNVKRRFARACGPNKEMRRAIASRFGEACALAGDHVDSPEALLSNGAYANSLWNYLALASSNADHFHPTTVYRFEEYYGSALELAQGASQSIENEDRGFRLAFYHAAFAGHHVSDAHSAGHMGFHRANSGATVSGKTHNLYNEQGRVVRDQIGNVWQTYGDGQICKSLLPKVEKDRTYHPEIIRVERARCSDSSHTIFRYVARNVHLFSREVISRFVYGKPIRGTLYSPSMYIPHDILTWGKWYSSINYSPTRTHTQFEGLTKDVGGSDFALAASASWAPLKRTRLRLGVGMGLGKNDDDGAIEADHVEGSFGVIFTPDIPFSIFTPEVFAEARGLARKGPSNNAIGPVFGARLMIEAYVANLSVEVGLQNLYDGSDWDMAPYFTLGVGFVTKTWGASAVNIRSVDHWADAEPATHVSQYLSEPDPQDLQNAYLSLAKMQPAVHACGKPAGSPKDLNLIISARSDGTITDLKLSRGSEALRSCISAALSGVNLGETRQGLVIEVPFEFEEETTEDLDSTGTLIKPQKPTSPGDTP